VQSIYMIDVDYFLVIFDLAFIKVKIFKWCFDCCCE